VALVLAACTTADPSPPAADAGAVNEASTDGAREPEGLDAHVDAEPADVAPGDAAEAGPDASDASEQDARSDDGGAEAGDSGLADGGDDGGDGGDGGLAGALLLPGENDVPYEMRAVCVVKPVNRVGAADSCCRESTYTAETRCDTMVHERLDGAGSLVLVIDPMQACTTTLTSTACSRTGTLPRCDSNGLTCPFTPAAPGGPAALAATYARRTLGTGANVTLADHYWSGCSSAGMVPITSPSCSTRSGDVVTTPTMRMATIAKTGVGELTLVSSWATNPPFRACSTPSASSAKTLGSTSFVTNASAMGGTFSLTGYTCTYVLTKK